MGGEKLSIKLPGEANSWYQGNNYLFFSDTTSPALTKVHKRTEEWSGIWIDESPDNKPWMFQDIEVFIRDMSYSQVFCKSYPGSACGTGTQNTLYRSKHTSAGYAAPSFWHEVGDKLRQNHLEHGSDLSKFVNTARPISPVLEFVGSSHGKWVDANNFCKSGNETEISSEELKNLELYCSKPKK